MHLSFICLFSRMASVHHYHPLFVLRPCRPRLPPHNVRECIKNCSGPKSFMYIARKSGIEGTSERQKKTTTKWSRNVAACCCFAYCSFFAFVAVATTAVQFTLLNYVQHLWAHFLDPATDLRSPPNSTQTTTHSPFARSILLKIPRAENKINYYSYKKLSLKDELWIEFIVITIYEYSVMRNTWRSDYLLKHF